METRVVITEPFYIYGCSLIHSALNNDMKVAVKGLIAAVHKEASRHKDHLGNSRMGKGMVFPLWNNSLLL